jgi:drug/metabolite transporter (DMT)-like permease
MSKSTKSTDWRGILAGIAGAMCFGFIPAFSKPAISIGLSPACVLTYRFGLAAIILGIYFAIRHKSLKLPLHCVPPMILLTVFYCFSGELLVLGYKYMSGGVTGVIHFSYPVFVMAILLLFYHERIRLSSIFAIVLALGGIYCLGVLGGQASFIPGANRVAGVAIVLASGIACAFYMVGVNKTSTRTLPSAVFTFWLLLLSAVAFLIISLAEGEMVLVTSGPLLGQFFGLAFIATVLSNFLLVYSIHHVGSTYASILGAVEPSTAVVLCIILFGESLNIAIAAGIVLIFSAVGIVVTRNG